MAEQVKNLTLQLESQHVQMSVNAPDWLVLPPPSPLTPIPPSTLTPRSPHLNRDTLDAANSASDILWHGSADGV